MTCVPNLCETAINNFREFLRIPTVHPNINFDASTEFLKKYADELGLGFKVLTLVPDKPIVLMTWEGSKPNEPSILLNSHADVVPVVEKNWTHPPFDAEMDDEGNIFGRGAQDMKCVSIMYLEAIRRFICKGVKCKRTFHLTFMPDEEIGGKSGMGTFVTTEDFKKLNIGFALDEAYVTPFDFYPVVYAENICWQIKIHCCGKTGDGASLQGDTPGKKLRAIINKFLEYRDKMVALKECSTNSITTESVTAVNLTQISGGIQTNMIPDELTAVFDVRISIYENLEEFEQMINAWCCGADVTLDYIMKEPKRPETNISCSNQFWKAMTMAAKKLDINLVPLISPGMTDSRYLRELDIPAFGFTPINDTPMRLHGDDEYVNKDKLLNGITIYMEILKHVGNI